MAFIDNRDLKVHTRHVHENYRPFTCEACNTSYKTKQGLTTHHKAHPDGDCINLKKLKKGEEGKTKVASQEDKPFECPECKKRFSKKSRMEWHLRMHSNERPFACSVSGCGKAFTQNQTLRNHMKQFHKSQVAVPSSASTSNSETTVNIVPNSMPSTIAVAVPENHHLASTSHMPTEIPISLRELKQEPLQIQPQVSNLTHHSTIQSLNLPQHNINNPNQRSTEDIMTPSGRDSVMSHMSDISTNSHASIVVVEPRSHQLQQQGLVPHANASTVSTTPLIQPQTHNISSVATSQVVAHSALGGMAAQLAAHSASIPSVAAKAAEAVLGRAAVVPHGNISTRDGRQSVADSWAAAVQASQHTSHVPPTNPPQFMPLNLQEALVQHQQQSPRLNPSNISQVHTSLHEPHHIGMVDQHQSSIQQMIQQQQQLLLQQQQQEQLQREEQQRRLKEQKEQRERERLAREREQRQLREQQERQQREQQEHYQRYQQQQQQLLHQQQQIAAAQVAAAQAQQVQVQQSVVPQQAPAANSTGSGFVRFYIIIWAFISLSCC